MSWPARVYVGLVVAFGLVAAVVMMPHVRHPAQALALAVLYVVSSSVSLVASTRYAVSLGYVVVIAAILIGGAPTALFVGASCALVWNPEGDALVKRVFNGAAIALTALVSGFVYEALGGPVGYLPAERLPRVLLVLGATVVTFYVANHLLVSGIVTLAAGVPFRSILWQIASWTATGYIAYGLFSLFLATLWIDFNPLISLLLLLPLLVARTTIRRYAEEQRAYDATVRALIQAVETKDHYTRGHSERVAAGSQMIARELAMREDRIESLRYAGMLHDVGKMGVPTPVLQKRGRLSESEAAAVRMHPMRGLEMLRDIEFLREAMAGIFHHHERVDGKGYPLGLAGAEIPEFARVISVADAFDSMTSTRSYRPAKSVAEAVKELRRCAGTQFDPVMVEAFCRAVERHGWTPNPEPFEGAAFDDDDPTTANDFSSVERRAVGVPLQRVEAAIDEERLDAMLDDEGVA